MTISKTFNNSLELAFKKAVEDKKDNNKAFISTALFKSKSEVKRIEIQSKGTSKKDDKKILPNALSD